MTKALWYCGYTHLFIFLLVLYKIFKRVYVTNETCIFSTKKKKNMHIYAFLIFMSKKKQNKPLLKKYYYEHKYIL